MRPLPLPPLTDHRVIKPTETALALKLLTPAELLKLKAVARLHARGLPPDVSWEDLLQEAITRMLLGSRVQPTGVSVVGFLAGVMRSLKAEHWRRVQRGEARVSARTEEGARQVEPRDPRPDPERELAARQELAAIERLFAGDHEALQIIAGLAAGLSAQEIRAATGLSKTEYDSARRRMRRALLREGLTCAPK
jgi:RNA polymerase sigma-70 factor (ECF subfamily)